MQTGRPTLIEGAPCIPREEIQAIHLDPNDNRLPLESAGAQVQTQCYNQINTCGSGDLTAPSACCRISFEAGWLVCDAFNAFDHMACVCNDNTVESPTREPTTQAPTIPPPPTLEPTKEPTPIVTSQPTSEPTNEPTNGPTNEPTKGPTNPPTVATESPTTKEPTNEPTAAPIVSTESPTNAPTKVPTNDPTKSPTSSPTMAPTISPAPTPQPTISKYFTTENKFDNDLDATIRQSQCKEDPPVIEFLQGSSFVYRYEVRVEEGAAVENVAGLWTNQLHDELSREFMACGSDGDEAFQYDSIWILQSKPHEIKYGLQCGTTLETPSSQEGIAIERAKDDEANESNSNDGTDQNCFVVEAEAKIIAYQSPIGKKKKQLWSDTDYESGAVADRFANDAIEFLSSVMSDGKGKLLEDDGLVVGVSFQGGEIVAADVEEQNGDDGTDQQEEDTSENNAIDNNGTANAPGSDPWTDTFVNPPENIAVGIEGPGSPNDNPNQKGLTPPIIATIAVVASVVVLIILMGVSRRRRQNKEPKEDEEYLRDIETNQSGSLHYAMGAVHHLDLSDSDDGDMNEPGPIVRSELDLEDRHTGDDNEQTNHFFNLSNVARSPSSRQRSQMGPLRATDEFLEGKSAATTPKGNHRGGGTPKSSSKAPPPSFVTSPRTYALRDTIKL